ncbi:hypothetical protein HRbin26_01202 [bacterium HR26]|nr:hypothetical protein HRbin26_01202 [bacterium HR26]
MDVLERRLERDRSLQRRDRRRVLAVSLVQVGQLEEQSQERLAERLAPHGRPVLVALLREQVASIEVNSRLVGRDLAGAASGCRGRFERLHVDPERPLRVKQQALAASLDERLRGSR